MALSTTQKAAIYRFLGYSDRAQDVDGVPAQRINQALAGLSASIETEVTTLLGSSADTATSNTLFGIQAAILAQRTRRKAMTVGSIALNPAELSQLRSEGTALLRQLAALLGLSILNNPFWGGGAGALSVPAFA